MEKFEGLDFYDIESLLTEEEIMIRDMVRDYVDEEVIPHIEKACEEVAKVKAAAEEDIERVRKELQARDRKMMEFWEQLQEMKSAISGV